MNDDSQFFIPKNAISAQPTTNAARKITANAIVMRPNWKLEKKMNEV